MSFLLQAVSENKNYSSTRTRAASSLFVLILKGALNPNLTNK